MEKRKQDGPQIFPRKRNGELGDNSRGYPHHRAIPAGARKILPWEASVDLFSWKIISYCHCQSEEEWTATSAGMRERNTLNQGTGRVRRKGVKHGDWFVHWNRQSVPKSTWTEKQVT
jgi:hypothetical protein